MNTDEIIKKYKKYLTKAQINGLIEATERTRQLHAGQRADAQAQLNQQYRSARRGLQNIGLASREGKIISGRESALKSSLERSYGNYNRQLRNVEQAQVEQQAARMANQTIRARQQQQEDDLQKQLEQLQKAEEERRQQLKDELRGGRNGVLTETGGGADYRLAENEAKSREQRKQQNERYRGMTDTGGGADYRSIEAGYKQERNARNTLNMLRADMSNNWNRAQTDGGDFMQAVNDAYQNPVRRYFADNRQGYEAYRNLPSQQQSTINNALRQAYEDIDDNAERWNRDIAAANNYNGAAQQQNIPGYEKTTTLSGSFKEEEGREDSYDTYRARNRRPVHPMSQNNPVAYAAEKARRERAAAYSTIYLISAALDKGVDIDLLLDDNFDVRYDAAIRSIESKLKDIKRQKIGDSTGTFEMLENATLQDYANWETARMLRDTFSPDGVYWMTYSNANAGKYLPEGAQKVRGGSSHNALTEYYRVSGKPYMQDGWKPYTYDEEHGTERSKYAAIINDFSRMIDDPAWMYSWGKGTEFGDDLAKLNQAIGNFNFSNMSDTQREAYNKAVRTYSQTKGTMIAGDANNTARKQKVETAIACAYYMTADEIDTYNSILAEQGEQKADEYFEFLLPQLADRLTYQVNRNNEASATAALSDPVDAILTSLASVPVNLYQGVTQPIKTMFAQQNDPTAARLEAMRSNTAGRFRQAMAAQMGNVGGFIYQTGLSAADSATVAMISSGIGNLLQGAGMAAKAATKAGEVIGGAILGGAAYNSAYDEALQRGLSPEKARVTAAGQGINEMLFEKLSIGTLLEKTGKSAIKTGKSAFIDYIVNMLVQASVEGSEEVFTDLANRIWDNRINGIYSEEIKTIQRYISEGMSPDEAKKKAFWEYAGQLGLSFLGGAISGGVMAGVGQGINNVKQGYGVFGQNNPYYQSVRDAKHFDRSMRNTLDTFDFKNEKAQEIQKKGKKSNQDYALLYDTMRAELYDQYKGNVEQAVDDGVISKEDAKLIEKWQQNGVQSVDNDGNVVGNENGITADEFAAVTDALEKVDVKPLLDISKADERLNLNKAVGAETADVIRRTETTEQDAEEKYQQTVREINNDTTLSPELKQKRLEAAERTRKNALNEASKTADTVLTNKKGIGAKLETDGNGTVIVWKKSGKVTYDFSTKDNPGHQTVDSMTATEQSALRIAKVVAASRPDVNVKVEAEFGVDENGDDHSKENGYYNPKTNTIHINMSGDNSVLWTLSHELTHHLANTDTEAYTALKTAIETALKDSKLTTTELEDRGFEYDLDRVDPYIAREGNLWDALVAFEREEHGYGKDAEEEVVARCCESFLGFDQFVKDFARKQYKSARAVNKFIAQMNIDMQRVSEEARQSAAQRNVWNDESPENQILRQLTEIDKIANLWRIAVNAEAKKRQAKREETRASTKDSVKRSDAEYLDLARRYESGDKSVEAELRKAVDASAKANGYMPVARFHQTKTAFNRFSTDNPVAGLHDSETPNGIFLKTNDHDIGIGGSIQMPLYLESGNYLHFLNRKEANAWYCKNVKGYESLQNEMESKLKEFEDRITEIEKQEFDPSKTDEEVDKLFEEEQRIIDEMRPVENEYRMRLRELLNQYFLNGKHHYDGIELDYDGHRWVNGKRENVHTFIAFRSNQVKSADLVTYDSDGNIIPLSERFKTDRTGEDAWKNEDIRYSLKDSVKPRSAQEQRDKGYKLSKSKFDSLYSAHKIDIGKRWGSIDAQINDILKNGFKGGSGAINVLPVSTYEINTWKGVRNYKDLLQMEKEGKLDNGYADRYRKELGDEYGKPVFNNVVQAEFALKKGETVLLVPKSEVQRDKVKQGFKPLPYEIVTAERDYQPLYELYEKSYDEYVSSTNEDNEDIRYSLKDDVKQTDITEYEHFNEEKYAKMSETERIEYREHIAEMQIRKEARERQRAIDRNRRIRRDLTAMLKRGNDRIVKMLANHTENSHVPVQLAQAVSEYAQRLNELLTTRVPMSGENAGIEKQTKKGALNAEKIIDALNRSYADEETIAALKAEDPSFDPRGLIPVQYDENGHIIKDETLVKMIKGMDSIIQGKHLSELTEDELRFVLNTMRGVIHTVTEANKVTVQGEQRNVYRESRQMANEVNSAAKVFGDKSNKITKFMNRYVIESLGLRRIAKLYSGSNENAVFVKMVDDLNEGALEQERIKQTLRGMFNEVTSKYAKEMDTWYGKNAEWIDTGFGFKITKGMRVSLAMHILNEQNLRNVEQAGLRIPDMKAYSKGNIKEAYTNGKVFRLTKAQAQKIVDNMTEAEKAYFEVAKEFFHKRSGYYINRTSLKLLGYSKAVVKNYFPIQTDDAYRTVKYDDVRQTASVEHPGFLETRKGTANEMYLNDITAVVNRQIDGVAKYAGLAIPMRNWNNIMNAWLFEENTDGEWVRSKAGNVHKVLERRMGYTNGKQDKSIAIIDYVDQFITDLTSPGVRDANEKVHAAEIAAKITSNYVKAVLTLNLSVSLSQLASVPTAAAEIPWKYIRQSLYGHIEGHLNRNASNDLIDQYTPIFAMRRAGTQTEVSEVMRRRGFADKAEQKLPGLLGWITAMDVAATRRLWYACERWVKGETDIPVGSDAFYKEVAKRYERVIQNTQPNFTVLQRSPVLRSKNAAARIIMMFGTQRMQNAGVFIESLAEVVQTKDKAKRKVAMKKFGRSLSGLITASIVLALGKALAKLVRGRMRQLQDKDKNINFGSVSKYILGEIGTSLAGSFMYVGEIYDIVHGVVSGITDGDYGYDDSFALPAAEALSTIIQFVKKKDWQYFEYMSGDHTDHEKWLKTRSFVNELMTVASYATGLPLANASKTILDGFVPAGQDIADWFKTGELNPWLHQSGKLDDAKTAANYKEWTNLGKKGSVYLYWEKKLKETGSYTDEEGDKVKQRTARAEELRKDKSLTNDERAMLLRMVTTGATSDGSVVYNENGKIIVDFTNEWRYKASLYTKRINIAEALWRDTTASPEEKAKLFSLMADDPFDVDGAVVYTMTKNDKGEMERNNVVVDFTNLNRYRVSTMLDDTRYEGFLNLVDMGVAEDIASTAFIQYSVQKKQESKGANDRFRDWLFTIVKNPEDRAKVDMAVIGNTVRVEGTIGYKENGEAYADYSSKEMFDLYTNGKKQEKSDAIISTTDTPEAKAKAFADTDNNYHAKGGIVYNDKDKVVADFTSDEAYRASQLGESHYEKYNDAVKYGMSKENAILAVEKHKEFTNDDDKDNATQYTTWVFNTYKDAKDRAIAGAIYSSKPVTVKDGRTYDENGYIYRDYTSAAWYKLSNRTLSKDGVNKRYEAAKRLEKYGYTAEKTVAAYVELDKLSKKTEWKSWLKAHGYTDDQIEIILWSRGWAKLD